MRYRLIGSLLLCLFSASMFAAKFSANTADLRVSESATRFSLQKEGAVVKLALENSRAGAVMEAVMVSGGEQQVTNTVNASVSTVVKDRLTVPQPQLAAPRLREYFPKTLLWQPQIETDKQGRAQLKFKLADNLTTWKMSVVGSTVDGEIGVAEKEFRAFQPFFAEHDPPKVLTEGDEISLPVVLRNYLDKTQSVKAEIKPESWFELLTPARKHAEVKAGDAAQVIFDFRVITSIKDGKQRVTAFGSDASDAIEKPVSVHPDGEEITATASAVFTSAGSLDPTCLKKRSKGRRALS